MRLCIRFVLAVILLCLVSSGSAYALEMKEMMMEVLETHPQVNEKLKEYNASVREKERYEAGYWPTVNLEGETGYQNISNSNTGYEYESDWVSGARITLSQMVYDGSRVKNDVETREAQARSELFRYCDTANQVAFAALESYVGVLKSHALEVLAQENVDTHLMILENVKAKVRSGSGGVSQLNRVQGRLAAAQSKLLTRRNDYKRAVFNFHKVFGRFVDGEEMVVPGFDHSLLPANLRAAFKSQMENHPTLIAADFNLESKEWEYKREKSNYMPSLHLEASHGFRQDYSGLVGEENDSKVLLKARYTLFDGGVRKAMTGKMVSQIHSRKNARERVKRSIINDLQLTWSGYKLLDAQIGALRKNLFFTKEALEAYKGEFKLGKRNLINILDAENEYQNAKAILEATKMDLLVAKYRVLFSTGTLIQDLGLSTGLIEELKAVKAVRPASRDELPLGVDMDGDGVEDAYDISANSEKGKEVNVLGADKTKTVNYLTDDLVLAKPEVQNIVRKKSDVNGDTFKPDVAVTLDMISFEKNSIELSASSKSVMRKLLEQIRPLSRDGMIQVTVNTGEMDSRSANYSLALQRAYNIMKIFSMHNMNTDVIRVFAGVSENGAQNNISLKVVTNLEDFKKGYGTLSSPKISFMEKSSDLNSEAAEALEFMAGEIRRAGNPPFDIVVFSNDFESASKNIRLAYARGEKIREMLGDAGCDISFAVPVAWGGYKSDQGIFGAPEAVLNRVDFVVREPLK